jgi:hypothetical protein
MRRVDWAMRSHASPRRMPQTKVTPVVIAILRKARSWSCVAGSRFHSAVLIDSSGRNRFLARAGARAEGCH